MPHYSLRRMFSRRQRAVGKPLADSLFPLSELASGESATFVELRGGWGFKGRLTSLGFTPGVPVLMVQNFGWGPLIVEVRGTRVALGRHEADRILVERSPS